MQTTYEHLRGALFACSCGALLDANRLMQELERAVEENAQLKTGNTYPVFQPQKRAPLEHIEGTMMRIPETGEVIDVKSKRALLFEIAASNNELRDCYSKRRIAKHYFDLKSACAIAFKTGDGALYAGLSFRASQVAQTFMKLSDLNSQESAVATMRDMRNLGHLSQPIGF